ncbi:MAG TPA: DUF58 domain-containing protein [Bryobacteraceae bacterium]|nr:DUF58 domain-containing protein [Bryobacteraceae bacterium]
MIKSLHDWWLPRAWRKFHAFWTQGVRQQVTGAGIAYTVALAVVGGGAFISTNNLLFLIFAAMLSTLLVSGFISRLGIAGLEINLLVPEHISARRRVRASIRIGNLKRMIPSFSVHLAGSKESGFDSTLYFPVIPGGESLEEPVELYFPRRGTQRERTFQFSTRFPFGFSERREMVTAHHDILVYPCVDPQPGFEELLAGVRGEMEAQQRGRGHDFYRIRRYEALESARHVDWRATAHTGELQVREFAREQDNRALIYLDLDTESQEWFESAVDCAAFLAFHLAERASQVRLQTQEFDVCSPEEGDIYTILKYLALVSPMRGKTPAAPDDLACYQLILTSNPQRMASLGWGSGEERGARMLGPDAFRGPVAS